MANTRLFLDVRGAKNGKPCGLKIAIAHKKKTALISLDVKLLPDKEWDPVKERVINHPEKLTLNSYISKVRSQIDSFILQLTNECRINTLTASEIKALCDEELHPEKKEARKKAEDLGKTFLFRFKQYAERMKPGSKRTFDHTLNRLEAFSADKGTNYLQNLRFEDMTPDWMQDFDSFIQFIVSIDYSL